MVSLYYSQVQNRQQGSILLSHLFSMWQHIFHFYYIFGFRIYFLCVANSMPMRLLLKGNNNLHSIGLYLSVGFSHRIRQVCSIYWLILAIYRYWHWEYSLNFFHQVQINYRSIAYRIHLEISFIIHIGISEF